MIQWTRVLFLRILKMHQINKILFITSFLLLFSFQNSCSDMGDNNSGISKELITVCTKFDDTTLLYFALNLNFDGGYSNNKVNQGQVYSDKFDPNIYDITKKTKHINDTACISFRIIGKTDESILCLMPNHLITGFKIYQNIYKPLFGFGNVTVDMTDKEFQDILTDKKQVLKRYCDSLESLNQANKK